jgi:hypothetical protein
MSILHFLPLSNDQTSTRALLGLDPIVLKITSALAIAWANHRKHNQRTIDLLHRVSAYPNSLDLPVTNFMI